MIRFLLEQVKSFLNEIEVKPVVLIEKYGAEQSLFQKFLRWGEAAHFAIVLLTSDDVGAGRFQYDDADIGAKALQFRARQNVILELGYFFGYLGWNRVFVLYKSPDKKFPNFEEPSDLKGVIFDTVDEQGNWKKILKDKLRKEGFQV